MTAVPTKHTKLVARVARTIGKAGSRMASAPVRFGLFADAHYADKVYGSRHCRDSADKLQACVDSFVQKGLDFAVCMGDLVDSSKDRALEIGYARTMADGFARFSGPRHWVLGNHDLSAFTKEEFLHYCGATRPPHYSFDVNGVHFVVQQGIPYISLRAMVVDPGLENNAYAIATAHPDGRIGIQGFGRQAGYAREVVDA